MKPLFVLLAGIATIFLVAPAYAKVVIVQQTFNQIQNWQFFSASPQSNESLEKPPQAITITFTQAVNPASASVKLFDPFNNLVKTDDVVINGAAMSAKIAPIKPGNGGVYRVEWKAGCQCNDSTLLSGSYYFNIR